MSWPLLHVDYFPFMISCRRPAAPTNWISDGTFDIVANGIAVVCIEQVPGQMCMHISVRKGGAGVAKQPECRAAETKCLSRQNKMHQIVSSA